jgi:DNA-binding response OmpR family regulator
MAARVLIVEDNDDLRESFGWLTNLWGYDSAGARDGEEALALVAAFVPHVVILDLGLPGAVTGEEVARRIRDTLGHGVFILVLTGWTQNADHEGALKAGADAFFLKPPDLHDLRETLDRATTAGTHRSSNNNR